ncbi:hypothetical protein [Tenacibaculum sp. E3R01]|uniref:hypothetical protein n=1 Tax=Tenacibaculum sp. E3R01 TaxID=2267227 RepID=UPI0011BE540A|nr:hypothetical protein [Tenacibaculum sp. E3R01]
MNTITTITDLIKFLKVGTSNGKTNQEVLVKKITRDATYEESTQSFRDFGSQHKEVNIPQTIYLNKDNNAFLKQQYTTGIFYKPITYQKDSALYPEEGIKEYIREFNITDELYNGGYGFYVNQEDTLVTSIQITTLNNLSNYAAYQASAFSYLKSYPIVPYKYTSVYGNSIADTIKVVPNTKSGLIHKFPVITKSFGTGFSYCLSYYYKKDSTEIRSIPPAEEDYQFIGLRIYCKDITTVLQFLNETIFSYYNEYTDFQSKWRNLFLIKLIEKIAPAYNNSKRHNKAAIVYHLAQPLYYAFNIDSLWNLLEGLAKGYIRNYLSINEEDLIIKTLRILYFRYTHRQKTKTIDGSKVLEEKDIGNKEINDLFIENLLRADKKILLYKLIDGLNGEHFQTYVYFIWSIWKSSSYANINPKTNKLIAITDKTPVLLAYQSKKILGFHSDNATINWKGDQPLIDISVSVKTGRFEEKTIEREDGNQKIIVEKQEKHQYSYHPFSPLVLQNGKNPAFLLKDKDQKEGTRFTKLPAFLLYANDQKAFWENVLTGVEYGVDILTTVSGVGNLIKVGRLLKLLKNGKKLLYKTKQVTTAIAITKAVAGAIEVSSGVVNTLLNLTSIDDTELGKSISKYLFYLEMVALTGEVSFFLKGKLQKTAKEIVENSNFTKSLDELVEKEKIDERLRNKVFEEINSIKLFDEPLKITSFIAKISKILPKVIDDAPKVLKEAEKIILKKANLIEDIEKQLEYAFVWNTEKNFKNLKPFTSGEVDGVIIGDAFGKGAKMTKQRRLSLKGAIMTHNHPNFTRFSDDDIKAFLKYQLKELRAINSKGIIYSLKLKSGSKISKEEITKMYKDLNEAKTKFAVKNLINAQSYADKQKLVSKFNVFEEEFVLNKIKDRIEYIIYK